MTHDVGNPCPGLEQTHNYGGNKPVNGICLLYYQGVYKIWLTHHLLILRNRHNKKWQHIL